jgi:uncharacterized protein YbjT (DUF2867 family)
MNRILAIGWNRHRRQPGFLSIGRGRRESPHMSAQPGAARYSPQVEVLRGDLTLPDTLDPCLDGIDTVFLVWTALPPPALPRITK